MSDTTNLDTEHDSYDEFLDDGIDAATGQARRGPAGRLYHGETSIDFYGRRWIGLGVSAALLLISVISLFAGGLNRSLDFTGGVVWSVPSAALTEAQAQIGRAHV